MTHTVFSVIKVMKRFLCRSVAQFEIEKYNELNPTVKLY